MESIILNQDAIDKWKYINEEYNLSLKSLKEYLEEVEFKFNQQFKKINKNKQILKDLEERKDCIKKGIIIENILKEIIPHSPFDIYKLENIDKILPFIEEQQCKKSKFKVCYTKSYFEQLITNEQEVLSYYKNSIMEENLKEIEKNIEDFASIIEILEFHDVDNLNELEIKSQELEKEIELGKKENRTVEYINNRESKLNTINEIFEKAINIIGKIEEEDEEKNSSSFTNFNINSNNINSNLINNDNYNNSESAPFNNEMNAINKQRKESEINNYNQNDFLDIIIRNEINYTNQENESYQNINQVHINHREFDEERLFPRNFNNDNQTPKNEQQQNSLIRKELEKIEDSLIDAGQTILSEKYFNLVSSSLKLLQLYTEYKKLIDEFFKNKTIFSPNLMKIENIKSNFEELIKSLEIEGQYKLDIKIFIETAKKNFENCDFKNTNEDINKAFKAFRPLNLREIKRLVADIDETANIISGKDIILFFGNSGAGKSTTIQYLLGLKMKMKKENGFDHYEADEESVDNFLNENPQMINNFKFINNLKNLKASSLMKSETKNINPLEFTYNNDNIYLCDIPGFQDTDGLEIDIVNGLLIIKAIHKANSVRPIFMISKLQIGDRANNNFKNFIVNIMGIIDLKINNRNVNYIFSKFEKESHNDIKHLINQFQQTFKDPDIQNFFNHLSKKIKDKCLILNPLNKKERENFLEYIIEDTDAIKMPELNFKLCLMEDSKQALINQVNLSAEMIMHCFNSYEFEIIKSKFDDIKFLTTLNISEYPKEKLKEIREKIEFLLKNQTNQHITSIENSLKNDIDVISLEDLRIYNNFRNALNDFSKIMKYEDSDLIILNELFFIEKFENILKENTERMRNLDLIDNKNLSFIKHMENIIKIFTNFENLYLTIKQIIFEKINNLIILIENNLQSKIKSTENLIIIDDFQYVDFDMKNFIENYQKISNSLKLYDIYLENKESLEKKKNRIKIGFENFIELKKEIAIKPLKIEEVIEKNNIHPINYINSLFTELKKISYFTEFFEINAIKFNVIDNLKNSISDLSVYKINLIPDQNEKMSLDDFPQYKEYLIRLEYLKQIDTVNLEMSLKINSLLDKIITYLRGLTKDLQDIINNQALEDNRDKKKILNFLKKRSQIFWIQDYRPEDFRVFNDEIVTHFFICIDKDLEELNFSNFTIEDPLNIKELMVRYLRLQTINNLMKDDDYFKNQNKDISSAMRNLENQSEENFKKISIFNDDLSLENNKNVHEIQENYKYLDLTNLGRYEESLIFLKEVVVLSNKYKFLDNFRKLQENFMDNLKLIFFNWKKCTAFLFEFFKNKLNVLKISNEKEQYLPKEDRKNIDSLVNLVQQFNKINSKYPNLWKIIEEDNDYIKEKVSKNIANLHKMFKEDICYYIKNSKELNIADNLLEYFRNLLDIFDINRERDGNNFSDSYDYLKNLYWEAIPGINDDIDKYFRRKDYLNLKKQLSILKCATDEGSKRIFSQVVYNIKFTAQENFRKMDNLIYVYLDKSLKMTNDAINLSEIMEEIENIFSNCKEFLLMQDSKIEEEHEEYNRLKNLIRIEFLKRIDELCDMSSNDNIESIDDVLTYYGQIKNIMSKVFKNDFSKFDSLKDTIENQFDEENQKYFKMELEDIAKNFYQISSFLKKLGRSKINSLNKIRMKLTQKLTDKINFEIENNLNIDKSNLEFENKFKMINKCMNLLDENFKNDIETTLKMKKEEFENNTLREADELEENIRNKRYKSVFTFYDKLQKKGKNESKLNYIKNKLEEQISESSNTIKNYLLELKIKEAIEEYENFVNPIRNFSKKINFPLKIENLRITFSGFYKSLKQKVDEFLNIYQRIFDKNNLLDDIDFNHIFAVQSSSQNYTINDEFKKNLESFKNDSKNLLEALLKCHSYMIKILNEKEFSESLSKSDNNEDDSILIDCNTINEFLDEDNRLDENLIKIHSLFDFLEKILSKLISVKNEIEASLVFEEEINKSEKEHTIYSFITFICLEDCYSLINRKKDIINQIFPGKNLDNAINLKISSIFSNANKKKSKIKNYLEDTKLYISLRNCPNDKLNELKIIFESIKIINCILCFSSSHHSKDDFPRESIKSFMETLMNLKIELIKEIQDLEPSKDHKHLGAIIKFFSDLDDFKEQLFDIKDLIKSIDTEFDQILTNKSIQLRNLDSKDVQRRAELLIIYKIIINCYQNKKPYYEKKLQTELDNFKNQSNSTILTKLYNQLIKNPFGNLLVKESKVFEAHLIFQFNTKTNKTLDVGYFIKNMRFGEDCDEHKTKQILDYNYRNFLNVYDNLIRQYIFDENSITKLITKIKDEFQRCCNNYDNEPIDWCDIKNKIPELLANLFALWTIKNSEYFKASEREELYLLKPHAAQVITMLRLLGVDKHDMENHLAEIKTGEGKSLFLGILSSFFSLFGYNVYVACYSKYLSERDHLAFQSFFDDLQISQKINYGTFNDLCEKVINRPMDIREHLRFYLDNQYFKVDSSMINKNSRGNIILLDEVDVFFSKEFYGNIYSPSTKLMDETINLLLDKIWNNFKDFSNIELRVFKETKEYLNVKRKFSFMGELIDICIANIFNDLKNYQDHRYILKEGRIGYIEQDNVVFNVNYGYKTLFAYYKEYEKKNISEETLNKMKYLMVRCGQFSYCHLLDNFHHILGVTGTLSVLNSEENSIIQNEFKINLKTISESIYGKSNLTFNEEKNLIIVEQEEYFKIISDNIKIGLHADGKGDKRAVLVFFENKKILEEFRLSDYFSEFRIKCNVINEEVCKSEKDRLIPYTTSSGNITLLTKILGRGTDFFSNDDIVNNNGGVHVIQTFFSESKSEEVQIKGRTARQGQKGSYELILNANELEKFGVSLDDAKKISYKKLNELREIYSIRKFKEDTQYIDNFKKKHIKSNKFKVDLEVGVKSKIMNYLLETNQIVKLENLFMKSASRTIILMDATGSMYSLIQNCKILINGVFDRLKLVLQNQNITTPFEIQIAVYRNYNVDQDQILQVSSWESDPENLRKFLNPIEVAGGWGREAIEIALNHAYYEHSIKPVSQVILLGDIGPNTQEEVQSKRKSSMYDWEKSKYKDIKFYKIELEKIQNSKLKINSFYLDLNAKKDFEEISNQTNGESKYLDIFSGKNDEFIKNIEKKILTSIALISNVNSEKLLAEYENIYSRSYN